LTLARDLASRVGTEAGLRRCGFIRDALIRDGLHDNPQIARPEEGEASGGTSRWRITPDPFILSKSELDFFLDLGDRLLAFYRALNHLYFDSLRGTQPAWIAAYLDQGKPEALITYSRMKRFRDLLPDVIRPDVIPTETGMVITELDSVPGGIGLTGSMSLAYARAYQEPDTDREHGAPCPQLVGGTDGGGIVRGFAAMLRARVGDRPGCIAIVVSDEAKAYRPEMTWMAAQLRDQGMETWCIDPREIRFTEEHLLVATDAGERPVSLVYRFFELFDLQNVSKAELMMYSAKKERTLVTPPFKPALEEKLAFALLRHPIMAPFWQKELGEESYDLLTGLMPRTWVLDPRPVPPCAIIPDLRLAGRAVSDWRDLTHASQKDRHLVIKPSGFSELAWGSRGVSVGHDLSQSAWAAAIETALGSFPTTPHVLQEFHKGRQFDLSYYDARVDDLVPMSGRARLCPYYFVTGERAELAGVLATICPLDKKLIHGMRDAIMVPCATLQTE
jgi:hypothetical protein